MTTEMFNLKDCADESGESQLETLYMLIDRLAQTGRFLSQQLSKLSGQ